MRWLGRTALAATGLCLIASSLPAQVPGLSEGEAKCQSSTGKALAKYVSKKAKCLGKCFRTARETSGPYGGCFSYTDPATYACIVDASEGAQARARASIEKKCSDEPGKDNCPECYGVGNCTTGEPLVGNEWELELLLTHIYCTEAGTGTPLAEVAKCEDAVAKALTKFIISKTKCFDECNKGMQKGTIPLGSCNVLIPSDLATHSCIFDPTTGAEAKAAASIEKACNRTGAKPGCYGPTLDTGAEWVGVMEAYSFTGPSLMSRWAQIYCGSPSGAFAN
jgi:hypothetical protein